MQGDRRTEPIGRDSLTLVREIRVKAGRIEDMHDDPEADEAELEALRDIRDAALELAELLYGPAPDGRQS